MTYVALLRGINVGGNMRVEMKRLKAVFESLGFTHVKTYINSGNVVFCSNENKNLVSLIEEAITKEFDLNIDVVVRNYLEILEISKQTNMEWLNDKIQKTDIMFLLDEVNDDSILEKLVIVQNIDTVIYTPGAVIWNLKRENIHKSGLLKIVGTPLYKQMTVRNVNTLRKLEVLMGEASKLESI